MDDASIKSIGVTGANGLLGWHLRCHALPFQDKIRILPADRATFDSPDRLRAFTRQCDAIVHLAGMNRGEPDEVAHVNVSLANELISAMEGVDRVRHLLYSSSLHIDGNTPYGRSKREAGQLFQRWSERNDVRFSNLVLPHVFGECGKPFYNSVVSTFCYQLAHDEPPQVNGDGRLELLHAQEVAELILGAIDRGHSGEARPRGVPLTVRELLASLQELSKQYARGIIPDLRDPFRLRLFNTYRSYLYPDRFPIETTLHSDHRGALFEAVKTENGGQAFLSTTKPGITRGEHYHFAKLERFLVVRGEALIRIRRLFDRGIREFRVSGDQPAFIDIPTLHTHNITNTGTDELLTLFWAHEIFDPDRPDTFGEAVAAE